MNIIVTGGSGFVGSHLVQRLEVMGHSVFVPRSSNYDLTDFCDVLRLFSDSFDKVDVVFHLAATVGGIGYNRVNPARLLYDNLAMGLNVIDESFRRCTSKLIFVSSVCAYPKFTPVPFKEEDLWNGYPEESNAPYGIAKRAIMEMVRAYHRQYGLCGVNVLLTNLYGDRDNFNLETSHVIPALIRRFIEAKEQGENSVTVWGTGNASRDFLFVEDAVDALVLAMEKLDNPESVNIGSGQEVMIVELAETIRRLIGYGGAIFWDASKPDGQPRRCLDITKAHALLGWEPRTSLENGLRRTIDWYMKAREHGD